MKKISTKAHFFLKFRVATPLVFEIQKKTVPMRHLWGKHAKTVPKNDTVFVVR